MNIEEFLRLLGVYLQSEWEPKWEKVSVRDLTGGNNLHYDVFIDVLDSEEEPWHITGNSQREWYDWYAIPWTFTIKSGKDQELHIDPWHYHDTNDQYWGLKTNHNEYEYVECTS